MQKKIIFIFLFISLFLISFASSQSIATLGKDFTGYKVQSVTGNEGVLFGKEGVSIAGSSVCLTPQVPDGYSKLEDVTSVDSKTEEIIITKELRTYNYPTTISLKDTIKKTILSIAGIKDGKYCFPIPLGLPEWKVGEESILIVSETSYNANLNNVTEGVNDIAPTHLNISDPDVVGYWDFEEGSGSVAYDYSNHSSDGTITGATYTTESKLGDYAMSFDGVNNVIDIDNDATYHFNLTDAFAISYWAKFNTFTNDQFVIITQKPSNGYRGWSSQIVSGKLRFQLLSDFPGGNYISVDLTNNLSTNQWHYVTISYNGTANWTNVKMYVDGNIAETTKIRDSLTGDTKTNAGQLRFGQREATAVNYLNGSIDQVMIFNKSLTADEVSALYNQTYPLFFPSGNMVFQSINLTGQTNIGITMDRCTTYYGSNFTLKVNNGSEQILSGCSSSEYNLDLGSNLTSSNISIGMNGGGNLSINYNQFYSPLLFRNITADSTLYSTIASLYPNINNTIPHIQLGRELIFK